MSRADRLTRRRLAQQASQEQPQTHAPTPRPTNSADYRREAHQLAARFVAAMAKQDYPDTVMVHVGHEISPWYVGGRRKAGWLIYSYDHVSSQRGDDVTTVVDTYLLANGKFARISGGGEGHAVYSYDLHLVDSLKKLLRRYGVE